MKVISNGTRKHEIIVDEADSCLLCKRFNVEGNHRCPLLTALALEDVVLRREEIEIDNCPMFSMSKVVN